MPQADLTSFHSLTFTSLLLVLFFFSFVFYYLVPFWSVFVKLGVKKTLAGFFLSKLVAKGNSPAIAVAKVSGYRNFRL